MHGRYQSKFIVDIIIIDWECCVKNMWRSIFEVNIIIIITIIIIDTKENPCWILGWLVAVGPFG